MPDIFLSYAHVDKHWVDAFAPFLERSLNQQMGRSKFDRVWKDDRFVNQPFSHEAQRQLDNASCLVACLSVGYFVSQWCMHELTEFSHRVGQQSGRVFCIELDEVVLRHKAPAAGHMLGYPFWHFDSLRRCSYPLYPTESAYEHLLADLSKDIAVTLRSDQQTDREQRVRQHTPTAASIAQENITQVNAGLAPKQRLIAAHTSTLTALKTRQQHLTMLIGNLHEQYGLETRVEEQRSIRRLLEEKRFLLNEVERNLILEKYR